jgi:hypothetical protein
MKESMWGYLILALGVLIITILIFVQNLTNVNEEDYYLSREVMSASMYDAVDYATYRSTGKLVMFKEKFVEVFIRRFAQSVTADRDYEINFYDIHEYPPKATVRIRTKTNEAGVTQSGFDVDVDTYITGILELNANNELDVKVVTE